MVLLRLMSDSFNGCMGQIKAIRLSVVVCLQTHGTQSALNGV